MRHFLSLLALLLPLALSGQTFTSGTLSNGVSFYLVTNGTTKGFADFALVQKGNTDAVKARAALQKTKGFSNIAPYRYFASKGVGYDKEGYVRYTPFGTTFTLHNVPIGESAVADSTLLEMVNIATLWPGDQAVIVSGDIDAAQILDALSTLSIMIPARKIPEITTPEHMTPEGAFRFEGRWADTPNNSSLEACYHMKRQSRNSMSTIEPLLARMFAAQMSDILTGRIRKAFAKAGIPLSSLKISYSGSDAPFEDERFCIFISTEEKSLAAASECLASVLSSLEMNGADKVEFELVKGRQICSSRALAREQRETNAALLERCVRAYLFGIPLKAGGEEESFLSKRILSSAQEREFLNKYISEVLSSSENLVLRYGSTQYLSDESDSLLGRFRDGWEKGRVQAPAWKLKIDTTRVIPAPMSKLKVISSAADPITGGSQWLFSNGMRVIFKKTSGSEVLFNLALRDGYASVPGITPGESAWIADLLRLSNVGPMNSEEFNGMLQANDICLQPRLSAVSLEIRGSAPRDKFPLTMRSLLTLCSQRSVNPAAVAQCKADFRQMSCAYDHSALSTEHKLEEMTFPDYAFSAHKRLENLHEDLPQRAEEFFESAFSNCSNGVLIIEGDFDEKGLKESLCRYLGGFKTGFATPVRPKVDKSVAPGNPKQEVSVGSIELGESKRAAYLKMTAEVPFSQTQVASLKVAQMIVRRSVVSALADLGANVEVSSDVDFYPRDMMSLTVCCTPCSESGLPSDVVPASSEVLLREMREAVRLACAGAPDPKIVSLYRSSLISEKEMDLQSPGHLMDATTLRYIYNKDVVSKWKDSALKVSPESVHSLLESLYHGSRVEFVVK